MARKKTPEKRQILPDPICGSQLVAKFINSVMREGKKSVAEKIVYGAFERMLTLSKAAKKKEDEKEGDGGESRGKSGTGGKAGLRPYKDKIIELFSKAIENVQPTVEVRARRVGGATYQIPVEVPLNRRLALAMRWLIESAEGRGGRTMAFRLADEIMDALHNRGGAVKKRENVHAMAHANRAFAHFRWS